MYEPCLCGSDDCPSCFPGRATRRPRYGLSAEDCDILNAEYYAAQAAADAEAEAAYEDLDEAEAMDTDIF